MDLLSRFFASNEDRERAARYARTAIAKHGVAANDSLRAMLTDHRRNKSKRVVRMALKIVEKSAL